MQATAAIRIFLPHAPSRTPVIYTSIHLQTQTAFNMQIEQPSAADAYQHAPLDYTKASIRLIHLQPDLSPDGLMQCTITRDTIYAPYTCLSYRWGAPEPSGVIRIDGKLFNVRQNLLDFLHVARHNKDTTKV